MSELINMTEAVRKLCATRPGVLLARAAFVAGAAAEDAAHEAWLADVPMSWLVVQHEQVAA